MKHRERPDETIEGKVAAAVERRIAPLLEGISKQIAALPPPRPAKTALEPEDRFVAIGKAAMVLGVHKATCLRYEDEGRLPPRRMMGGRTGWLMSELRALLKSLPPPPKAVAPPISTTRIEGAAMSNTTKPSAATRPTDLRRPLPEKYAEIEGVLRLKSAELHEQQKIVLEQQKMLLELQEAVKVDFSELQRHKALLEVEIVDKTRQFKAALDDLAQEFLESREHLINSEILRLLASIGRALMDGDDEADEAAL